MAAREVKREVKGRSAEEPGPEAGEDEVRDAQLVALEQREHGPAGEGVGERDPGARGGLHPVGGREEQRGWEQGEEDVLLVDLVGAEEERPGRGSGGVEEEALVRLEEEERAGRGDGG
nr:hypothetical protein CFP56_22465 [Quercus suber]